ncbi:YkgJ family cysteine cluster protein [Clostridium sp. MSJ-11]|uniref:YkgJ family cysteine cluster protein n=1 Tax=Clostridium mobile TaxID=2841512 RepID=A0ABS6EFU1_9CLOT|nr:YkgJ family cysteine cluster protein [Clostridium mobile]MBU5484064.1 YkgJ family cysteine cluster protein [Clostridium mobile]
MVKQKFKSLGKNYLGENMLYSEAENDKVYDEIASTLIEEIHENELSLSNGKKLLKEIYEIYDEGNRQFEKYASCKKGCGHCCCLYVDCSPIEAELIREYVQANFSQDEINLLKNKINEVVPIMPTTLDMEENNEHALHYLNKKLPCIFLSEEKTCTIYPVRPFNCRKFLTITSPEECILGEHVVKLNPSINNIGILSINSLSMNVTRFRRLVVQNEQDYKSLFKGIPLWFKNGFEDIDRSVE